MAKKTAADKKIDKRIEAAYYAVANGIQIDIMDIPKVFAVGRAFVADGVDDDTLKTMIAAYVDTIRKN